MRERMIEMIQNSVGGCARHWAEIIADNLLANGVIVPPVAVGQTVFFPIEDWDGEPFIDEVVIEGVCIHRGTWHITWGRDEHSPLSEAFLSRELAEEALNGQKKL